MRGLYRVSLLAVSAVLLIASPALAVDPFADYRIPDHNWKSWLADLSGSANQRHEEAVSFGRFDAGSLSGHGSMSLAGGYDSETFGHQYTLSATLNGTRDHQSQHDEDPGSTRDSDRNQQSANQLFSGQLAIDVFPWRMPVGFTAGTGADLRLDQDWNSQERGTTTPTTQLQQVQNSTRGRYSVAAHFALSTGYGRVRDATPVYQTLILEQRLLETGTIAHALSRTAHEKLSALYTVESQLAFAHDRPTKYFWRELERLLRDDGVLPSGSLDAWSVQRLLEPLTITGSAARPRGFFAGPQVLLTTNRVHTSTAGAFSQTFFQADTLVAASEFTSPRTESNERDDFLLSGLAVEYHMPVGLYWQTDAFSRALLTESGDQLLMHSAVRVAWLVSDRWYAAAALAHDANAPGAGLERKVESWSLHHDASLSYFIEDDWALTLGWDLTQDHSSGGSSHVESFSLGVSYRLAGLLGAPGIFDTMRLTPPQ